MIKMVYDGKTKTWKEWKEWEKPYATIEAESEEALEYLEQRIEKQKAKKPTPPEIDEDFAVCPRCERIVYDIYNYCPGCGQKLDWSDIE